MSLRVGAAGLGFVCFKRDGKSVICWLGKQQMQKKPCMLPWGVAVGEALSRSHQGKRGLLTEP